MKGAITFVILLAMGLISYSQNLVVNPGFEEWGKISRPSGWNHVENCLKDSSSVVSGNYACKHSGLTTTSDLGQTIPVVPGKEYRLSLFNKTLITANGRGSRIWCYWKNSDNSSIYDPATDDIMRPSEYFTCDTWEQYSISVIAPAEAEAFYLEVRTNTNSIAFWDDITFEEMVTTFDNEENESALLIYPNPASHFITIYNSFTIGNIAIINLSGSTLWSDNFSGENTIRIPVSDFPNGIYLVRIISSGKCIVRKFIIKSN